MIKFICDNSIDYGVGFWTIYDGRLVLKQTFDCITGGICQFLSEVSLKLRGSRSIKEELLDLGHKFSFFGEKLKKWKGFREWEDGERTE